MAKQEAAQQFPPQHQEQQPGLRSAMQPKPESMRADYRGSNKLAGKVALITGGIRGNAVAPGPIWTPLIPATFDKEKVSHFGADTPMQRAGQPSEVAPSFVFLASAEKHIAPSLVLRYNSIGFPSGPKLNRSAAIAPHAIPTLHHYKRTWKDNSHAYCSTYRPSSFWLCHL